MQNLGKDAQGDLNQDLAMRCHRPPGHKLKLFWHLRSESFLGGCQYVEVEVFLDGFWLVVCCWFDCWPMCQGWCWDVLARPSSVRATFEPESHRWLSSQLSAEKNSSNLRLMEDYQTLVFLQSSHQINPDISSVRILGLSLTWSPGRAASLSTMDTTSPLTRGSPPVSRI